ncbi:MAG: hypothetical protein P8K80_06220 [Phycisphaerales bacterium]|nr:hypothetical protein [Phycisphaerales bacterium]
MKQLITSLAIVLLSAEAAMADTITVAPGESIQAAIDLAVAGDVVELSAGSWQEHLVIPDHVLTLRGAVDKLGLPASSVDGGADRAMTIENNMKGVEFEHLVISGQHSNTGGGVYIYRSNPSFINCRFENCHADGTSTHDGGGAVYIYSTSLSHTPSFDACRFINNSADKGGAVGLRSASGPYSYSATFADCHFQGNSANSGGAISGIYSSKLGADLDRCTLINNQSTTNTGHAFHGISELSTSLHSCSIVLDGADPADLISGAWENLGHNCLSVAWSDADGDLRPDDCDQCDGPEFDLDLNGWSDCAQVDHEDGTVTFNVADGTQIQPALDFIRAGTVVELAPGTYTAPSGGLVMPDYSFTIRGVIDESGQLASSINGGGDRAMTIVETLESPILERLVITGQHALYGGGAYIYRSNPTFINCRFENCHATGEGAYDGGGAVLLHGTGPAHVTTFDGCAFIGNSGNRGGAIGLRASSSIYEYSAVAVNCLFKDNTANHGGAIGTFYTYDHGIDIDQCLFFNNTAAIEGSAIAYTSAISTSIGSSAFCGLEPIISGSWEDLGGNCFTESCEDLDEDSIPDECDDVIDDECSADLDGNGVIEVFDLLQIISDWGTPDSDITGDGMTDVLDLLAAINQWGPCPP